MAARDNLEFFQNGGTAHLRLFWQWPGQLQELIPASAFWHAEEDTHRAQELREGQRKRQEMFPLAMKAEIYPPGQKPTGAGPIPLKPGPHLLIDDCFIASSENLTRRVNRPVRDREVFFDRHPEKGAWDHAHAWIDEQVPVGDEVYLYYGGYARGHKVNRFEERQIGLVKMPRDRYVARAAGETPGSLRTPLVSLEAGSLTLNATVNGEIRVRLVDPAGRPLPGFDWDDGGPIRGDSLAHPVRWKGSLSEQLGKPVRLEFSLREAELYGFELIP